MGKGKSDTRPSEDRAEHPCPPEPEAVTAYYLSIVPVSGGLRALTLLRVVPGAGVARRQLFASDHLNDLMDELGKVAYRLYGLNEGGALWDELSR